MMFRNWLQKKSHKNKNEAHFLQHTAVMNSTFIKHLRSTYILIDKLDYDKSIRGIGVALSELVKMGSGNNRYYEDDNFDDDGHVDGPGDAKDKHIDRSDITFPTSLHSFSEDISGMESSGLS